MGVEQKDVVVTQETREFFLQSFRFAYGEHMGARNPDSVAEFERRAAANARVAVWTQVLTHLGLSEEMYAIKGRTSVVLDSISDPRLLT